MKTFTQSISVLNAKNTTQDYSKNERYTLFELNLYLTEDEYSQSFFYIGWNCLDASLIKTVDYSRLRNGGAGEARY